LGKAKGFASKLFGKAKSALTPNETEAQKQQRLEKGVRAGVGAVERLSGNSVTGALINPVLGAVRLRYRLGVLEATVQEGYWTVRGELQRMAKKTSKKAGPPVTLTLPTTLAAHENVAGPGRGHTKAKHVAKDDAFLRQRLINEISPPIPAATTFADEAAAEALINAHLTAQQTAIETWLKSASGAPHVIKAPAPGAGQGFKRPAVNPLDAAAIAAQPKATFDKIRIVLRKGGPAGWYILTAMPDF
ncbi:MAG: hypothetical protein KA764_19925, partial [Anaerolineales bacterium]|nr:hypothetical protein [Anaerolineales bacterium]